VDFREQRSQFVKTDNQEKFLEIFDKAPDFDVFG
jgi:hypothetical protein